MASDSDDLDKNIENLKSTVKSSFARIYAALKARELKTLRQLDAIRKQCQDNKDLTRNCVQNIHINYGSESTLLDNVGNFGAIDFERLNFDSSIFTLEDYVCPNDDHMYSYKTIEDLSQEDEKDLMAIEEAALKEITRTDNCVCYVNIRSEDVSKKFRDIKTVAAESDVSPNKKPPDDCVAVNDIGTPADSNTLLESNDSGTPVDEEKSEVSDEDLKKIDPTDDWLNSINGHTETEPTQVTDVMEHSTIVCS